MSNKEKNRNYKYDGSTVGGIILVILGIIFLLNSSGIITEILSILLLIPGMRLMLKYYKNR